MNEKSKENNKGKLKNRIMILLIILLLLMFIVICYLLTNNNDKTFENGIFLNNSSKSIESTDDYIYWYAMSDFTVTDKNPYVIIKNPKENKDLYAFKYSYYFANSETPFYETDYVKGGDTIKINFENVLDEGTYNNVTVITTAYKADSLDTSLNKVQSHINITVR